MNAATFFDLVITSSRKIQTLTFLLFTFNFMMLLSISTGCSENLSMSTHHFRASNKVAQRVLQHDTNEFPFPNIKYLESASKPSEMPFKSRQTPAGSGQGIIRDISRQGKFLHLFTVVKFPKNPCRGTLNNLNGTCLTSQQCADNQGTVSGTCASGFGVCCAYERTCGATTRINVTYFVNPDSPNVSTEPQTCVLRINKTNSNVVQLRLDFEIFMLNGVTDGTCATDVFQVTGQNVDNQIPPICGLNNGQHIYIDVGNSPGPIMLTTTTSGMGNRLWRIKVTQLERGNPSLAPSECLQYFTGSSGSLKSFNFDSPTPPTGQSNYVNNLNYALCIRREVGSCVIRYTATMDMNSFDLEIPDQQSGLDGTCTGDYLVVPGAQDAPPATISRTGSRFCGAALSATPGSATSNPIINDLIGPTQLTFITNGNAPTGAADRGFNLRYQQIPCSMSGKK